VEVVEVVVVDVDDDASPLLVLLLLPSTTSPSTAAADSSLFSFDTLLLLWVEVLHFQVGLVRSHIQDWSISVRVESTASVVNALLISHQMVVCPLGIAAEQAMPS